MKGFGSIVGELKTLFSNLDIDGKAAKEMYLKASKTVKEVIAIFKNKKK